MSRIGSVKHEENTNPKNNISFGNNYNTIDTDQMENRQTNLNGIVEEEYHEFEHKITSLTWNGAILNIEGYCYIKDIPLEKNFDVKKRLVLVNTENGERQEFILEDTPLDNLKIQNSIDDSYMWAGFKGTINFATAVKGKRMPLETGIYITFLEIETLLRTRGKVVIKVPLGDIREFLADDFYSTKMEFYSTKSQLLYNLMVTYDLNSKSMLLQSNKLKDFNPVSYMVT